MHASELFNLTGQVAVVTGGGRGLGRQMAQGLAESGAHVVVCSRKYEPCLDVSEQLKEHGVDALAFACDVTDPDSIQDVVDKTVDHFGKIDILVNNSGATWGAPVEDMPLSAWQKVFQVNVTGTFLMSQAVGRVMLKQGEGAIINISSVAGMKGSDPEYMDTIGYNSSKGAVLTFTKDLAVKWGPRGIRVNAIAPGFFPTKMSEVLMERSGEAFLKNTPLRKFGSEDDLKGAVIFLSSKASKHITGDVIIIDGGSHAM